MADRNVVTLNSSVPRLEIPDASDTYKMESDVSIVGKTLTVTNSTQNVIGKTKFTSDLQCGTAGSKGALKYPILEGYTEKVVALTISTNAVEFDLHAGNFFTVDMSSATGAVTPTWTNGDSGKAQSWTVVFTQPGAGSVYSISWPSSVKWAGGTAPTLTAVNGAIDIYSFLTTDGASSNIMGFVNGTNLS